MTVYLYSKLSDSVVNGAPDPAIPAYWTANGNNKVVSCSPSGDYAFGYSIVSNTAISYLVDCTTRPPTRQWKDPLWLGEIPDFTIELWATPMCCDDEGSLWGKSGDNDGKIIEVPLSDHVPVEAFTWSNANGKSQGLTPLFMFTLTASDSSINIVMVPEGTTGHDNTLVYLGVKGTPGLTEFDTADTGHSWVVWHTFIDDNDDVWVAGGGVNADTSTMYLWRLTDVTGTSPYSDLQTFTMPAAARYPIGYFANGCYVGAWSKVILEADYLFCAHLDDSSLDTRNISSAPLYGYQEATVPANPDHYFLYSEADGDLRTVVELKPDLTDGETWNLDDWSAGDQTVVGQFGDLKTEEPIYMDSQHAFAAARSWHDADSEDDLELADFFFYYFGAEGGTPGDIPNQGHTHPQILRR
jgi:hypothetical protein